MQFNLLNRLPGWRFCRVWVVYLLVQGMLGAAVEKRFLCRCLFRLLLFFFICKLDFRYQIILLVGLTDVLVEWAVLRQESKTDM